MSEEKKDTHVSEGWGSAKEYLDSLKGGCIDNPSLSKCKGFYGHLQGGQKGQTIKGGQDGHCK